MHVPSTLGPQVVALTMLFRCTDGQPLKSIMKPLLALTFGRNGDIRRHRRNARFVQIVREKDVVAVQRSCP